MDTEDKIAEVMERLVNQGKVCTPQEFADAAQIVREQLEEREDDNDT